MDKGPIPGGTAVFTRVNSIVITYMAMAGTLALKAKYMRANMHTTRRMAMEF